MKIGIIGGSGLYDIEGFESRKWVKVTTPFGSPSDQLLCGKVAGREVVFLTRHARGHRILPGELNHRANIYALKKLGVGWILSISAVGSLQEKYRPLDIVLPDQFFDRTKKGLEHTFFGKGIVAHTSFADPLCKTLRETLRKCAEEILSPQAGTPVPPTAPKVHFGGTYVNMEGPMFSTKAESHAYRQLGFDIIGMTNLGEAKLAREAEMCYASMAMVTDYDCWHVSEEIVTGEMVMQTLLKNVETAKRIVRAAIGRIPLQADCSCKHALATSLVTDKKLWPVATRRKLAPILKPYLASR